MLVELRDRSEVDEMLANEPYVRAGLYTDVEVHDWGRWTPIDALLKAQYRGGS